MATRSEVGAAELLDAITCLGAKSPIMTDVTGEQVLFRLPETTRLYALEKLEAFGEAPAAQRRHAELCCAMCEAARGLRTSTAGWMARFRRMIDDVRVALDWCFSPQGDATVGAKLTVASALRLDEPTGPGGTWLDLLRDPLFSAPHLEMLTACCERPFAADAITRAESRIASWCRPELLRIEAEAILKDARSGAEGTAEALFRRSLDVAGEQGALSWELRTATSLARLWRRQDRGHEAHTLLASIYARFTEGFDTTDLVRARSLLDELAASP